MFPGNLTGAAVLMKAPFDVQRTKVWKNGPEIVRLPGPCECPWQPDPTTTSSVCREWPSKSLQERYGMCVTLSGSPTRWNRGLVLSSYKGGIESISERPDRPVSERFR